MDVAAVFFGLARVDDGEGLGGDMETHGGLVDLLRVKLHLAGKLFGGDQVIVAESLENAFFVDVDFQFALGRIDRIGRVALRYDRQWGE